MKPQELTRTVLGKFFESVFTKNDDGDNILPQFENRVSENKVLNEIAFTELDIFIKLQKLNEDKACGKYSEHILNGLMSSVELRKVFRPFLFLIYLNDIQERVNSNVKKIC